MRAVTVRRLLSTLALSSGLIALGCSPAGSAATTVLSTSTSGYVGSSTSVGSGTTGAGSTSTGVGTSVASAGSDTTDGETAPTRDVGWDSDFGTGGPAGCQGKIDFLFVISATMVDEITQEKFLPALPGFIEVIETRFEDFDHHILVIDTNAHWGNDICTETCSQPTCKRGEPCCPLSSPAGEPCCGIEDYPCSQLDLVGQCDTTMGAGVVFPAGWNATNAPCKIDGGKRYLDKGQTDLAETFQCIARVGDDWLNKTRPMEGMLAAIGPELNGPGGCNEGFLREDALLMVTLVAPARDFWSEGTPTSWANAVIDAKGGDPTSIVMYFIGDGECPYNDWPCLMTKKFPYHLIVDNVEGDYAAGFEDAAGLVDEACAQLIPQ
ncbi:MAG: hypothetical protein R3A79_18865 [Nannocystaceae bacterium]